MKMLTQGMQTYNSPNKLQRDLQAWFTLHPFSNGFDPDFEYFWAKMSDEDCIMFCLKYPEYAEMFKEV
jgi:hypothetical protein|tara:strand:- start:70 stop:273 length:204 start_codon:yes stop_codon:yes gene_type:complete